MSSTCGTGNTAMTEFLIRYGLLTVELVVFALLVGITLMEI